MREVITTESIEMRSRRARCFSSFSRSFHPFCVSLTMERLIRSARQLLIVRTYEESSTCKMQVYGRLHHCRNPGNKEWLQNERKWIITTTDESHITNSTGQSHKLAEEKKRLGTTSTQSQLNTVPEARHPEPFLARRDFPSKKKACSAKLSRISQSLRCRANILPFESQFDSRFRLKSASKCKHSHAITEEQTNVSLCLAKVAIFLGLLIRLFLVGRQINNPIKASR